MLTAQNEQLHHRVQTTAHPHCVACSLLNRNGLHLEFTVTHSGVESHFEGDKAFEGYPGILHGGVIATILDGAMGNCLFARGQSAVTVEMTTRFRQPVLINLHATVKAWIVRPSEPLYPLEAQIIQEGQVRATGKGKFYHRPELASCWKESNE